MKCSVYNLFERVWYGVRQFFPEPTSGTEMKNPPAAKKEKQIFSLIDKRDVYKTVDLKWQKDSFYEVLNQFYIYKAYNS